MRTKRPVEDPKAAHTLNSGDLVRLSGTRTHKKLIAVRRLPNGRVLLTFSDYRASVNPDRLIATI